MVSFQAILSPKSLYHHNKTISYLDTSPRLSRPSNCKKRKLDDDHRPHRNTAEPSITTFSSSTVDLHLETPLPSEWQRCLDIQSGEIHFFNTRTKKRTLSDPRATDTKDQTPSTTMSLDLELNLPCGDQPNKRAKKSDDSNSKYNRPGLSLFSSLSASPAGVVVDKEQQEEMVAAACKKCHMLVVLCKSSPACPNCKFMHPPDQSTPPKLFKPTHSLIC